MLRIFSLGSRCPTLQRTAQATSIRFLSNKSPKILIFGGATHPAIAVSSSKDLHKPHQYKFQGNENNNINIPKRFTNNFTSWQSTGFELDKMADQQPSKTLLMQHSKRSPLFGRLSEDQKKRLAQIDSTLTKEMDQIIKWEEHASRFADGEFDVAKGSEIIIGLKKGYDARTAVIGPNNPDNAYNLFLRALVEFRCERVNDCLETCERGISMTEIIKSESLRISKELDKIAEQNPNIFDATQYPSAFELNDAILSKMSTKEQERGLWMEIAGSRTSGKISHYDNECTKASFFNIMGDAYELNQTYPEAEKWFKKTLDLLKYEKKSVQCKILVVASLTGLSRCAEKLNDLDKAEVALMEAIDQLQEDADEKSDRLTLQLAKQFNSSRYSTLGQYYWRLGKIRITKDTYNEAEDAFKKGIAVVSKDVQNLYTLFVVLILELSNLHTLTGDFNRAIGVIQGCLRTLAALGKSETLDGALCYHRLALLSLRTGDPRKSSENQDKAHETWKKLLVKAKAEKNDELITTLSRYIANSFLVQAKIQETMGNDDFARKILEGSQSFIERVFGSEDRHVVESLMMQASIAHRSGQRVMEQLMTSKYQLEDKIDDTGFLDPADSLIGNPSQTSLTGTDEQKMQSKIRKGFAKIEEKYGERMASMSKEELIEFAEKEAASIENELNAEGDGQEGEGKQKDDPSATDTPEEAKLRQRYYENEVAAIDAYTKAKNILEQLTKDKTARNSRDFFLLATAQRSLGELVAGEDDEKAINLFKSSVQTNTARKTLFAEEDLNVEYVYEEGKSIVEVGDYHLSEANLEAADQCYNQAFGCFDLVLKHCADTPAEARAILSMIEVISGKEQIAQINVDNASFKVLRNQKIALAERYQELEKLYKNSQPRQ